MNNSSYENFFQLHSTFHPDALLGPVDRTIGLARSSIPWTVTGSDFRLVLAYPASCMILPSYVSALDKTY